MNSSFGPTRTIRRKLMSVVLVTTLAALLINGVALVVLELQTYREGQLAATRTQGEILARASAAAVAFNDRKEASEALRLLRENPQVFGAAIYLPNGELFASYARERQTVPPSWTKTDGLQFSGDRIRGFLRIVENGVPVGAVYLDVRHNLYDRLTQFSGILIAALLVALALALVLSTALQRSITGPIQDIAEAARRVIERDDYSVRVQKRTNDETGTLVEAFNRMLEEIEARTTALGESEQRFRTIADSAPVLMWMNDESGAVFVNRAYVEFLGVRGLVDVRQYDWTQYVHPEDRHDYVKAYLDAAARSGVFDKEFRFRRHDGEYRWMRSVAVPRLDADGTRLGYTGCTFDVHDARLADRRKDDFLATLAHELRNPLAPVRNAVEVLRVKRPADADIARSSEVIARQVTQMARLLDDLLDVSRITRDKLELRKQPVTLDAVVESAVETSRPLLDAAGHRLEIALHNPIYVDGDPTRLAQIFANLLNNAAKYTPRGGSIRLSAERRGDCVVVSVKDNGIGFAPEMRPRLFEMFSQAAPALDRSQGGLGIGLSLVKALTEMHGGSVDAHSDGPGQGSEFLVRLPVMAPDSIRGTTSAAAKLESSAGTRRRLLVVDDLKDAADSLAALLRMLGHEVHVAYDGEQGVAAARRLKPEVVFLDLGMPRLNGYEACRIIRSDFGQEVFLVALTGWGQDDDRRRSAAAGFDRHLVKPVEPQAVTDVLLSMPQARGGRIAGGNRG